MGIPIRTGALVRTGVGAIIWAYLSGQAGYRTGVGGPTYQDRVHG